MLSAACALAGPPAAAGREALYSLAAQRRLDEVSRRLTSGSRPSRVVQVREHSAELAEAAEDRRPQGCGGAAQAATQRALRLGSPAMSASDRKPVIVVGYDGSEASRAALRLAARRAGPGGKVFIVYAYHLPSDFRGYPYYDRMLSDHKDHGRALLDAIPRIGNDEELNVGYETELIGGRPAQAIADVARVRDADEIIVGARGRGRLRALLGSVSHELLHLADRPVVVIPLAAIADEAEEAEQA